MGYEHLEVERRSGVGWLWLNRPDKRNALSQDLWEDLPEAVSELDSDPDVRVVVVAGRGPDFTVGIDLEMLAGLRPEGRSDVDRRSALYRSIRRLQHTMTALSTAAKPVIAAVHGHCLGAGIDLISACDIRLAAAEATFSVRETRLGIVADVGTLQRLPSVVSSGHVAELVYTGRDIDADRAEKIGLVNDVYADVDALHAAVQALGEEVAANSPLAVQGAKAVLRAEEGMTTEQALDHVALWNAAFLDSDDLAEALTALKERRPAHFTGA